MSQTTTRKWLAERDVRLSREYLKVALSEIVGDKLDDSGDGKWLVNRQSNVTYNTYLLPGPDPEMEMTPIVFDPRTGDPNFGKSGATWFVLYEPFANIVRLLPWTKFTKYVREVNGLPCHQNGIMWVRMYGSSFEVCMNLPRADRAGLFTSARDLPRGEFLAWRDMKLAGRADYCDLGGSPCFSRDWCSTTDTLQHCCPQSGPGSHDTRAGQV